MKTTIEETPAVENLSGKFEASINQLGIFDTVKVMRWVRGNMMCKDGDVRRAVCPEEHVETEDGRANHTPEYVYVVCVTELVPEDKGKNGVVSYMLTNEDEQRIQPLLQEGYKLAMGGGYDSPTASTTDTSPYNNGDVWKQDEKDGRRRGHFVIETRETRLRRMQDDLEYAQKAFRPHSADRVKMLMNRVKEKYGDLMEQEPIEK